MAALRTVVAAYLLVAGVTAAGAQTPAAVTPSQDYYMWLSDPIDAQVAADTTPIPAGQGAIFVPTLSDGLSEPESVVSQNGQDVAGGINGARIVVAPGDYIVRVGSAPRTQMVEISVTVTAGETTVVPLEWGGLRVHVVDENDVPYRGVYELIRSSDQQPYVVGFGADTLEGERLMTLLVHEDLYRMVRQGSNYRARTDFSTVLVPPGALVHYKLVIDTDTGEFRGSGVMAPRELGLVTEENPLNIRWSVGASLPFAKSENVVGANNQTSSGLDVFFDNYISYQRGDNYFSNILEVEGGFSKIDPEGQPDLPLTKTRDRLRVDTFYTRFVLPRFGPYARFGLLTNMFESNTLFTEDRNAIRIFKDGTTQEEFVPANTHFRTGDSFAPVNLRQGAGANVRLIQNRIFILDVRAGVGFRQFLINDSFFLDDDPATEALEYVQLENFNRSGLETTVVGTLRFRRLVMNTDLDLFGDFDEWRGNVDWRNSIGWRLAGGLSLDYRYDLLRQPDVRDENQTTQSLLLRYSFGN